MFVFLCHEERSGLAPARLPVTLLCLAAGPRSYAWIYWMIETMLKDPPADHEPENAQAEGQGGAEKAGFALTESHSPLPKSRRTFSQSLAEGEFARDTP